MSSNSRIVWGGNEAIFIVYLFSALPTKTFIWNIVFRPLIKGYIAANYTSFQYVWGTDQNSM